jgi:Ca2+-binding EF-hand superfamily protein
MAVSKEAEEEDHLRESEEKLRKLDRIREMSRDKVFDTDEDGTLSIEELRAAMGLPLIMETLAEIQVISGLQPEELFALLDTRGDGEVTSGDMIIQLAREAIHNEHQQLMELKISTNMKHNWVRTALDQMQTDFQTVTKEIKRELKDIRKYLSGHANRNQGNPPPNPPDGQGVKAPSPDHGLLCHGLTNMSSFSDESLPAAQEQDNGFAKRLDGVEAELGGVRDSVEALTKAVTCLAAKLDNRKSQEEDTRRSSPVDQLAADHLAIAWNELEHHTHMGPRNFKPRLPGTPTTA